MRRWYLSVVEVSSDPSLGLEAEQDKLTETMNKLDRKSKDASSKLKRNYDS